MKILPFLVLCLFSYCLASAATVDTVDIYSPSMRKKIKCVVITPDAYKDKKLRFPVIYMLHGLTDSYAYWVQDIPNIKDAADRYKQILVCPDGGYDSWYFDSPIDSTRRYETHIYKEVIPYIDTHYRTLADRRHRAITGLSMGGHGSLYMALRHTNVFGAVGSTSGVVDFTPFKSVEAGMQDIIGDTIKYAQNWVDMTVFNMIDKYPADSLSIIIDCGMEDYFLQVNRNFHEKMRRLNIPHDYIERPGGHVNAYWQNAIEYQLLFFSKYFGREKVSTVPAD